MSEIEKNEMEMLEQGEDMASQILDETSEEENQDSQVDSSRDAENDVEDDIEDDTEKEEAEDGVEDEGDAEDEKQQAPEDVESEEQAEMKRIADLQSGFTKVSQTNAELRKKLIERIERDLDGFEELSQEEYQILREEDPEAALEYLEQLETVKQQLAEKEELERQAEADMYYALQEKVAQTVVNLAEELGVNPEDRDAISDFFHSPELDAASRILVDPKYGFSRQADGTFSLDQLRVAYKLATLEDEKVSARTNGYQRAIESIERAAKGGSKLSQAQAKGKSFSRKRKLSQEEALAMGEEDLQKLLNEE